MKKKYFVYILSNKNRTTLYVGVTGNIKERLRQHSSKENRGFTNKYNCTDLLYYEKYDYVNEAIRREKQIKKYSRSKKDNLIMKLNPEAKSLNLFVNSVEDDDL